MYYVYMLRCKDNSIYTGITTDIERRIKEHSDKNGRCAKYTFVHHVESLEIAWKTENRILASKLEYFLKTLKKVQKEKLIKNICNLDELLGDKIEYEKYKLVRNG